MGNESFSLTSLSEILQNSFKAVYRDQTTVENSKLRNIYIL